MVLFNESGFQLELLIEEDERYEDVCDLDGWIEIPGKGIWSATFITLTELGQLLDERWQSGERASGVYFATPGLVLLRKPGVEGILEAARDLVETELYATVLVKQVEIQSDDD